MGPRSTRRRPSFCSPRVRLHLETGVWFALIVVGGTICGCCMCTLIVGFGSALHNLTQSLVGWLLCAPALHRALMVFVEQKTYFEQMQAFAEQPGIGSSARAATNWSGGRTLAMGWAACMMSCSSSLPSSTAGGTATTAGAGSQSTQPRNSSRSHSRTMDSGRDSFFRVRNWRWKRLTFAHAGSTGGGASSGRATGSSSGASGGSSGGSGGGGGSSGGSGPSDCPIQVAVDDDIMQYALDLATAFKRARDVYRFEKCLRRFRPYYHCIGASIHYHHHTLSGVRATVGAAEGREQQQKLPHHYRRRTTASTLSLIHI